MLQIKEYNKLDPSKFDIESQTDKENVDYTVAQIMRVENKRQTKQNSKNTLQRWTQYAVTEKETTTNVKTQNTTNMYE